ncbi:MAG: ATP-binding cassette domain-containing protein [Patescibacteria group bacterium]
MAANQQKDKIIDPVCGMDLAGLEDLEKFVFQEREFYFCGRACQARFTGNPQKFSGAPFVRLDNVWKIFKIGEIETKVLCGLSFNIWQGDFVAMIGASGSGKSTALNMLGFLDRPTSGNIFLKNTNVAELDDATRAEMRSRTFGFVFQQYNLVPWLTAEENVLLPTIFAGRAATREKASADFEMIGLKERMTHRPFELSGGEQQRVALLRALTNNPEIILGDEPTGNLDSATGNKILDILINLNKREGKTLVIVTHDADIAERADQIITIKDGRVFRNHHAKETYTE